MKRSIGSPATLTAKATFPGLSTLGSASDTQFLAIRGGKRNSPLRFFDASIGDFPAMILGPIFDDPVNVLWVTPIMENEREIAVSQGSRQLASQLPMERWRSA